MFSGVSGVKECIAFSLNDCNSFVCTRVSGAATQQHKAKKITKVMVSLIQCLGESCRRSYQVSIPAG